MRRKTRTAKIPSYDVVINILNKLSADYFFLKGEMDVNTPAVTGVQQQRLTELNAQCCR